jgi:homoserine dehydrogenase
MTPVDVVRSIEADILLEATPVNLKHGQPGLDTVRTALQRGMHTVLANKGPLALAYAELAALSDMGEVSEERGDPRDWPALRFSACVAAHYQPSPLDDAISPVRASCGSRQC